MIRISQYTNRVMIGAAAILLAACAYPTTSTTQGGTSSAIYFETFPSSAEVFVDGQLVGLASQFDGSEQTLAVPTGTHSVLVRNGGAILYEKKVYVGRDSALKISQ